MPRARKTQSGAKAQSVPDSVPGVRYGEGVEQQQLAQAMPTPDMQDGGAPAAAGPQPLDPSMLGGLMGNAPVGALRASASPDEPITAGLASGPGPGREAMYNAKPSPLGRTLQQLANMTGDPVFSELARKAGI